MTALATTPYAEAVGAYLASAAAFVLLGLSGWFERVIRLIPPGVAAGLLAGILLQFGIQAFGGVSVDPALAGLLIAAYVILKRVTARYAVVGILALGLAFLLLQQRVDLSGLELRLAAPVFTRPEFSLNAMLSVALPLFLITLTGQYMPGMLVLRNDGFKTSANPIVTITGLGSLLMAPFGSHAFNIAAITAAICTGRESHEDPSNAGSPASRRACSTSWWACSGSRWRRSSWLFRDLHHHAGGPGAAGHHRRQPGRRAGRSEDARGFADHLPGGGRQHQAVRHRRRLLGPVHRPAGAPGAERQVAGPQGAGRSGAALPAAAHPAPAAAKPAPGR